MYHWVPNALTGTARLNTYEMLKRRKLSTRNALVVEYDLSVDIALVGSNQNLADRLARVPQRWFSIVKKETKNASVYWCHKRAEPRSTDRYPSTK